ncbi:serine protease [Bradyrhizobium sediminis]|uniref:Serine protease n=1 Tax=Bradyrhizobium sediminis TaxID=2840469 RepID=A0A975NFP2_9BRAD|nr:serine protease [Bradyrhizobium sediminis]QWG14273.1 serine protease [Bradyrhizobium sediminis]
MKWLLSVVFAAAGMWVPASAAPLPPDVTKVVSFIFHADDTGNVARDDSKKPIPMGTGFFIGIKLEDPTKSGIYFVTAKHVLKDEQGRYRKRVYVRVNSKEGDPNLAPLDVLPGASNVYTHSDATVDLAVVPVALDERILDFRFIGEELLTTKQSLKELKIGEGSDVFFVGLFTSFYGQRKNFPIARFGRVAMISDEKIPWRDGPSQPIQEADLYLLETQSYGGNSGSPVFFYLGPDRIPGQLFTGADIKLAGVMRGTFLNGSPIQFRQSPTAVIPFSTQNIGIAAVTPAHLLHDILYSEPLVKMRAAIGGDKKPQEPASIKPTEPAQ